MTGVGGIGKTAVAGRTIARMREDGSCRYPPVDLSSRAPRSTRRTFAAIPIVLMSRPPGVTRISVCPELILVSSSAMVSAQVRIIRHSGQTDIRVAPGGLLINTIGLAAEVRRVLRDALGLRSAVR